MSLMALVSCRFDHPKEDLSDIKLVQLMLVCLDLMVFAVRPNQENRLSLMASVLYVFFLAVLGSFLCTK